ncbi:hypothetical protein [Holdemanella porci]|uniref:hypothetical protein n=1 Tax=Holdemanella porci TaxID=2652276 RepID=UPI003F91A228
MFKISCEKGCQTPDKQSEIISIDIKELLFIVLSGFATGASWLCFYRALLLKSERS